MFSSRFQNFVLCGLLALFASPTGLRPTVWAQEDAGAAAREKLVADRFMQVLLRRPSPGTALDRVYGYHIQAGSLDTLLDELKTQAAAGGDDAGAKAMLLGLLQLQRGSDAAAADSLELAERLRADDAMASYFLGKALLLVGRNEAAAEALERAIERKPGRTEALPVFTELGRLYGRGQQNEKALSVWNRLEETFPGDIRVGEQIAQTLAEEGQDDAALERYEALAKKSASENDSRSIGYQIAAAELKRRVGRGEDALADLESILGRLRPSSWLHSDVQRRIEAGFLRSGDYGALADYYAAQVDEQPDALELRMRLGQTLSKAGRLSEAETVLKETVELAPTQSEPRLALVDMLQATGKYGAAADQLRVLVEQDAENPDYLIRLGSTILEDTEMPVAQRRQSAAKAWRQLATARQDDAVLTAQVADLMRRIEENDEAITLYQRAISLAPDQPQYREYLGEFQNRLGRKDDAMATWQSIASDDRATRDNYVRLAEVLNTFEHPDKALDAFDQAAKMDPTFSQRLRFIELLGRAERYDDALSQLDLAGADAETPEEREQLLKSRIGIYAASGTLTERIADATTTAEASKAVADYRRLALMLDAGARSSEAIGAIESAMKADATDIGSMEVAAELYRKSSRSGDAITVYRRLAEVDTRFLPNYLKRISTLQMELGQVDEALATAEELIQAGPGNPESYRFYAQQCFRVGRDDEGIDKLRRALRAAPRDAEARRALASALDDRFRTDEAIELYWALLEDSSELGEQRGLVKSLASLYGRKGDFDRLLGRLELRGRENSDMRTATLLISEAHRAVDDLGAASQTLEPLLVENPRDAELIAQMVVLAEAADDLDGALSYQEQLTKLADTPENRNRELKLLVDSGQMDRAEATIQRMQLSSDPITMINMIDRASGRGEKDSALRFCEATLEKIPDLWEVRVRMAAELILSKKFDEAIKQIEIIESLDLPGETQSERLKDTLAKSQSAAKSAIFKKPSTKSQVTNRIKRYSDLRSLSYFFRLGRYASNSYQFSLSQSRGATDPDDVDHAKTLVTAYRMVIASKSGKLDEFIAAEQIEDEELIATSDDPDRIERLFLFSELIPFVRSSGATPADTLRSTELRWRLAELVPEASREMVYQTLSSRASVRARSAQQPSSDTLITMPLTDDQFAMVDKSLEKAKKDRNSDSPFSRRAYLTGYLYQEYEAAGKEAEAKELRDSISLSAESPELTVASLNYATRFTENDKAFEIIDEVRSKLPEWAQTISKSDLSSLQRAVQSVGSLEGIEEAKSFSIGDLLISMEAIAMKDQRPSRRSSATTGTVQTYSRISGNYRSMQLQVPFASSLLPSTLVQSIAQSGLVKPAGGPDEPSPTDNAWTEHLSQSELVLADDPNLALVESRLREAIVAYSHWWQNDLGSTYDAIVAISEASPENNDWWIERARMAAELKMPEASLEALDSIHPLDQGTLRVRELAAMNLASQLGNLERAKTAARRLFGMRLDKQTELALSDQLTRLGMREMATAVLQRSRSRGGQSVSELLELADRYTAAGEAESATEVAYSAMRKLSRGDERNEDYYRRRAVEFLRKANRLDAVVAQAERRVESSPQSVLLRSELAELYTAAGRQEDADRVFEQIAELQPNDPKTMWAAGKRLYEAKKYQEAAEKYAAAVAKDSKLLERGYYELERCIRECEDPDAVYGLLVDINLDGLRAYQTSRLMNVSRQSSSHGDDEEERIGENQIAFVRKILSETSIGEMDNILRTAKENPLIARTDAVADAVRRVLLDDELLVPTSQLWQGGSYGNGGQIYGLLEPCLSILDENEKLRDEVRQSWTKSAEGENGAPIAKLLLLTLDLDVDPTSTSKAATSLLELGLSKIPYLLWWQFGQLIELKEPYYDLAINVYAHVSEVVGDSNMGYEYTVGPRLADAYVRAGKTEQARAALLKAYRLTDNSEDNQFNPGYGDYQDLNTYGSIADKLAKSGSPLDAIPIYSRAIADSDRFKRAASWGGDRSMETRFRKNLERIVESLNEEQFERFLDLDRYQFASNQTDQVIEPQDEEDTQDEQDTQDDAAESTPSRAEFRLMPMQMSPDSEASESSVAALVVSKLAADENGRKILASFDKASSEQLNDTPGDLALLGMRALVAIETKQDSAPERIKAITAAMPTIDSDTKRARFDEAVFALQSPAIVGMAREDSESVQSASAELADRLIELAGATERKEVSETLMAAKIKYSAGDFADPANAAELFAQLLDVAVTKQTPARVTNGDAAKECLRIARLAENAKAWPTVLDAIERALAGGPPLRNMGADSGSGSAFMLQTSRNRNTGRPENDDVTEIGLKAESLVSSLAKAAEDDLDLAESIYGVLSKVVMPATRPTEVFPYAEDLLRNQTSGAFFVQQDNDDDQLAPKSLSHWLVWSAAKLDKTDELAARLLSLSGSSPTPVDVDLILAQIALTKSDPAAIDDAWKRLAGTIGVATDDDDSQRSDGESKASDTKAGINAALHFVIPLHHRDGLTEQVQQIERALMKMAADDDVAAAARQVWQWMITEAIESPDLDDASVSEYFDDFLGTVRRQYLRFDPEVAQSQSFYVMRNFASTALMQQRFAFAARLTRRSDIGIENARRSFSSFYLSKASLEQKYDFLKHTMLGDSGANESASSGQDASGDSEPSSALLNFSSFPTYLVPPEPLRSEATGVETARKLDVADPRFPLDSMAQSIVAVAIQIGKTDELISLLAPHVQTPGDDVDAIIGHAMLADGRIDEAGEVLDRVASHLAGTIPSEKVKTEMPHESAALVIAFSKIDGYADRVANAWKSVLEHARKRDVGLPMAYYNKMTTLLTDSFASGATPDQELDHFASFQMPYISIPVSQPNAPLWDVRDGKLFYGGGMDLNAMMLKYPLVGDFEFSCRQVRHPYSGFGLTVGGFSYAAAAHNNSATIRGLIGRQQIKIKTDAAKKDGDNEFTLKLAGDKVSFLVNGTQITSQTRNDSAPFVGLAMGSYATCEIADIRVTGSPTIPREVNLLHPRLTGWSCPIISGTLPEVHLPIGPDQVEREVMANRAALASETTNNNYAWFVKDGVLAVGIRESSNNPGPQRHMQYQRPLLDGETIRFESVYEPEKTECHPSLGPVVVLLRPEGVKLRWLFKSGSIESRDAEAQHEVDPDEILGDGKPDLRVNDSNEIVMQRGGDRVTVSVNGKEVCRFTPSMDQRPGLYAESDRRVEVRSIKLSGDWPETLPETLVGADR